MRRIRWILIIAVVVFLAVLVGMTMAHRASARNALKKYKAELRAKGEKLTFAELRSSPATNAHDVRIVLTNAALTLGKIPLSPGNWDGMKFAAPGRVRLAWVGDGPPASYWQSPPVWYANRGPDAYDWATIMARFTEAEEALAAIRKVMEHSPANEGFKWQTNIFSRPPTPFVSVRLSAQWLAGATLNDLHNGQHEAALADLGALIGLANLNREEAGLVHQMIRVAVGGLGVSATWQALQAPGWNEHQLGRLQSNWETVDFLAAAEQGWIGERAIGVAVWDQARTSRWSNVEVQFAAFPSSNVTAKTMVTDYLLFPLYRATSMEEDELFRLRVMQGVMETIRAVRTGQPLQQAKGSMDKSMAELMSISHPVERFRYWLTSISTPYFHKAFQTCVRNEIQRRMTVAAIALKRYELANGKQAPTLDALVPEFLSAVPLDLMSGKPLCYRLSADGSFVLYSVGEDGVDNGGDPNPASGGKFGLWEGRDAVWPLPARPEDAELEPPKK